MPNFRHELFFRTLPQSHELQQLAAAAQRPLGAGGHTNKCWRPPHTPIEVTGCGRTDTGVQASQYFMHFDFEGLFPKDLLRRINKLLPTDVAIRSIF